MEAASLQLRRRPLHPSPLNPPPPPPTPGRGPARPPLAVRRAAAPDGARPAAPGPRPGGGVRPAAGPRPGGAPLEGAGVPPAREPPVRGRRVRPCHRLK